MRPVLTARQREILDFIRSFMIQAGYPPTVREIGAHFGFVPRSVFDHLKALERKGYLRRTALKSRWKATRSRFTAAARRNQPRASRCSANAIRPSFDVSSNSIPRWTRARFQRRSSKAC